MSNVVDGKLITVEEFEYFVDKEATDSLNRIYFEESVRCWMPKNDLRLIGLDRTFIIKADNEGIGFVLLCTPFRDINRSYIIHMGITKAYQGKGISKIVYDHILHNVNEGFIIGEIEINNNRSLNAMKEEYGELLFTLDDYGFYLLHNDIHEHFYEYGLDEVLRHYNVEDKKEEILQGVSKTKR